MIDWIIAGALTAVLLAVIADGLALRQLLLRCKKINPISRSDKRLIRWYAEGFAHSRSVTAWLRGGSLALCVLAIVLDAHPSTIVGSLLLAAIAHYEARISEALQRKFTKFEGLPSAGSALPG